MRGGVRHHPVVLAGAQGRAAHLQLLAVASLEIEANAPHTRRRAHGGLSGWRGVRVVRGGRRDLPGVFALRSLGVCIDPGDPRGLQRAVLPRDVESEPALGLLHLGALRLHIGSMVRISTCIITRDVLGQEIHASGDFERGRDASCLTCCKAFARFGRREVSPRGGQQHLRIYRHPSACDQVSEIGLKLLELENMKISHEGLGLAKQHVVHSAQASPPWISVGWT